MKKAAFKGLIILVGVVLACVLFSGTLRSITAAKVQMTKAQTGILTSEITMTGELYWPATESVIVSGMNSDDTLLVRRIRVSAGSWVEAGQVIAECEVSEVDVRLSSLQEAYEEKENEYLELDRKNRQFQLTPQQKGWYEAYRTLKSARLSEQSALQDLKVAAWKAGADLEGDGTPPSGTTDKETLKAWETLKACKEDVKTAQDAFDRYNLFQVSDDVVSWLTNRAELEAELSGLADQITRLHILKETVAGISAPHDGYITAADLKAGDILSQGAAVVEMTEEGVLPVIRLDPGTGRKTFSAGMEAELSAGDGTVTANLAGMTVSETGRPCVDVPLSRADISELGGVQALVETGSVTAAVKWQAESSSTLIPTAALRGTEGAYYIYVVQADNAETGNRNAGFRRISRKNVTVLGQSGSVTSVSEPLAGSIIVYMEDRPLEDGCEVMPYDGN